jgi:uncharacterized protein (TIGR01777 family)
MKVLIAGASGLIGTEVARALAADGVGVGALVRNTARAVENLPAGATLYPWDAIKGAPPPAAFEGVDVVVNLVGEPIAQKRWTEERKKVLRDTRIVGTRTLVNELRGLARRPRVLIAASAVGYYGDRGDEILTEASPSGTGFLAELARDWEAEAMRATELDMRVVILRSGSVLSPRGGMLRKILPLFRLGLGGRLGNGAQWFPWIHVDDEVALIRHAIDNERVSGPLNGVAPEPVTNRELTVALGEALARPAALAAPAFALRAALGGLAEALLLSSQRVMPARTLESGFRFRHALLRPALKELLGSLRAAA